MLKAVLSFINGIIAIFRRLMCFLNIKRRRKTSGNILPMHNHVTAPNITQSIPSNETELESWDAWGSNPMSGGEQMSNNQYGNLAGSQSANYGSRHTHLYGRQQSAEEEQDVDFFSDMQPHFKKATKILVRRKEDTVADSNSFTNRLAVQSNVPLNQDSDLGTWEESENAWADEANEDLSLEARETLRETRRAEREARMAEQLRRKQQRSHAGPSLAAVKLS